MNIDPKKLANIIILFNFIIGFSAIVVQVYASTTNVSDYKDKQAVTDLIGVGLVTLSASISVTGSCMAAGIALRSVASSGFAAAVEKPELKSYMFIIGGLAEGIAIYGLLIAIMILGKI